MSVGWFLVAVVACIGAFVAWRGSRIAGGALLVGALVVALGTAGVTLPQRDPAVAADERERDAAWVLRVELSVKPARLPSGVTDRWVGLPAVASVRPDDTGGLLVHGEPDSNVVERRAVEAALSGNRFVTSVEVVD